MTCQVHVTWRAAPDEADNGVLELALKGIALAQLSGARICFTSQLYPNSADAVAGARLTVRDGSCHVLEDITATTIAIADLAFRPRHVGEGPASLWIDLPDGTRIIPELRPMRRDPKMPEHPAQMPQKPHRAQPFCIPAPRSLVGGNADHPVTCDLRNIDPAVTAMLGDLGIDIRQIGDPKGARVSSLPDSAMAADSYEITVGKTEVRITYGPGGMLSGLITLAQIIWGTSRGYPGLTDGMQISDAPVYSWRGLHLDCVRHFFGVDELHKLLSVMCWLKLNRFHWHLTDDEGWRIDLPQCPDLTRIGASRGADLAVTPQLGDGPEGHTGSYSAADIAHIVALADARGITVIPEVDLPGHSTALLRALPALADPDEVPGSYRSVQNFANNAINPAVPGCVDTVGAILDDILPMFPGGYLHLGGDEIPSGVWATSPLAQARAGEAGLSETSDLQIPFFAHFANWLDAKGKRICLWDEQGRLQSVPPERSIIFCWQDTAIASDLAAKGYPLVLCPAQATYLDIAETPDWDALGSGWAGHCSLSDAYAFDPANQVPAAQHHLIEGVQACIWTEQIRTPADLASHVFPRLFAVAENAWSARDRKDWQRFETMALDGSDHLRGVLAGGFAGVDL